MSHSIAIAGNPNSGKTTLFNALTGAHQHVGNYPGVTVEKKQGVVEIDHEKFEVVDLPGTYSLTSFTIEEKVSRDFIINDKPTAVINVVDASNLERNLYLTVQILEMGIPLVIALNMVDVAEKRKIEINTERLSEFLGVPVIPTVARTSEGKKELLASVYDFKVRSPHPKPLKISYGPDVDPLLIQMEGELEKNPNIKMGLPVRWIAIKFIENDTIIHEQIRKQDPACYERLQLKLSVLAQHLETTLETYPEAIIADYRYGFLKALLKKGVVHFELDKNRLFLSDQIDRVVTHRVLGPIIMMAVMYGLYQVVFTYSETPIGWFESFFGWLSLSIGNMLPDGLIKSLITSGIIDGVGGVLGFVPIIMFMFFGIAIFEDSGYLARVAFMLDRVFRVFGLHGSAVMPFIVSGGIAGGCAVPGVMATRTLKSKKERIATLLTVPFMNCGAKLPVFALLIAAFFPGQRANMMFLLTIISWAGALMVAKFLRLTVVKGAPTPFVMELPPYRLPTLKGLLIHTWERTWQYMKKAGTVILAISVLFWAAMTFPGLDDSRKEAFQLQKAEVMSQAPIEIGNALTDGSGAVIESDDFARTRELLGEIDSAEAELALKNSFAGRAGTLLEPISRFAGLDWRTNIAMIGGIAAKEVIVSTLGTAYSLGAIEADHSESLSQTLANSPHWRPLTGFSVILFTMFYSPCFVTLVCISKESGSWKWSAFSLVFNAVLAFMIAATCFQVGSLLGY